MNEWIKPPLCLFIYMLLQSDFVLDKKFGPIKEIANLIPIPIPIRIRIGNIS